MKALRISRLGIFTLAVVGGTASARYLSPEPLLQEPTYVADMAKQDTFEGEKPTLKNQVQSITTPMSVEAVAELQKDKSNGPLLDLLLGGLNITGFGTNTYEPKKK